MIYLDFRFEIDKESLYVGIRESPVQQLLDTELVVSLYVSPEEHHFREGGYLGVGRYCLVSHFAETDNGAAHDAHQFINIYVLIHIEVENQEQHVDFLKDVRVRYYSHYRYQFEHVQVLYGITIINIYLAFCRSSRK